MPFLLSSRSILLSQIAPVVQKNALLLGADAATDFGPAYLPSIKGLHIDAYTGHTHGNGKVALAVSCFALSELSSDDLTKSLENMHRLASFVMLADFKVPERNIEIPACLLMRGLRMTGPAHKGCFSTFGGLEGLLYAERKRFAIKERLSLLGGSLMCVLAKSLR